tara:strand:+ start:223 stop:861 length:639 start_codon:yes stop_codon:yes gene_type:complete
MVFSKKNKFFQNLNYKNLLLISKILINIEHFICYGTLLGITRDKNIIKGDDDIDFLIDYKNKKKILEKMKSYKSFKLNKRVKNKFFIQFTKKDAGFKTFVDFYFYINKSNKSYIIEKHNFLSNIKDPKFALHIPKKIIFPIRKDKNFKVISVPNKPKELCRFLYGNSWKTPLKKNFGYRMEIVDNRPLLIKRSYTGSLTRQFKKKLNNLIRS